MINIYSMCRTCCIYIWEGIYIGAVFLSISCMEELVKRTCEDFTKEVTPDSRTSRKLSPPHRHPPSGQLWVLRSHLCKGLRLDSRRSHVLAPCPWLWAAFQACCRRTSWRNSRRLRRSSARQAGCGDVWSSNVKNVKNPMAMQLKFSHEKRPKKGLDNPWKTPHVRLYNAIPIQPW